MSASEIRIEQIENVASICRMDQSGATPPTGPFLDLDDKAYRIDEDDINLWSNLTDTFYFGAVPAFSVAGFRVGTIVPDHTGFTVEYYDSGSAWTPLAFHHDSTQGFTQDGFITWTVPGTWALTTVDGASAFFMRVRSTGVNTAGRGHHFMPVIQGGPAIILLPKFAPKDKRYTRDMNATLYRKDVVQKFVESVSVDCSQISFTHPELNYLRYLIEYRHKCRLTDLASNLGLGGVISFSLDAYYKWFEGYITGQLDKTASPFKMKPDQYMLEMDVDNAQSIFAALGPQPA